MKRISTKLKGATALPVTPPSSALLDVGMGHFNILISEW